MSAVIRLRFYLVILLFGLWSGSFWSIWVTLLLIIAASIHSQYRTGYLVLMLGAAYGAWQPTLWLQQDSLKTWHHQSISAQGVIDSWPDTRGHEKRFYLKSDLVNKTSTQGRILVITKSKEDFTRGQRVKVAGKLSPVSNFPGFDYQRYLGRFHVRSILRAKQLEVLNKSQNPLVPGRRWFEKNLRTYLPSPNAELAAGVLIGTKTELPEPAQTRFKTSGLQHLIVVSGSNVAILMCLIGWFGRRLGPKINIFFSTCILFVFIFITGADPPVVRAGIFGFLILIAAQIGRLIDVRNLLLLAAVLMGVFNPLIVQTDISFWLSFAATAGIILGWPGWQKITKSWSIPPSLNLLLGISFCAQTAVLPILIMNFEIFPWVGLVSNLIAEPVIPLTMGASFIAGLAGVLPEILHKLLSLPALILTEWLHQTALWFGAWPGLVLPKVYGQILAVIWICLALWCLFSQKYQDKYWQNLDLNHHLHDDTERA